MPVMGRGAAAATWDVQHTHFLVVPGLGLNGDANDLWAYDPATTAWLAQNVVNYVAPDLPDLLRQADGAQVRTAAGPV